MDNYLQQLLNHKRFGVGIVSSGTSGDKKLIHRTPDNLKSCNEVAIESQELTKASKILTVTNMSHAGGLLLQTLPAYTLGCKVIDVEKFNAFNFLKKVKGYTLKNGEINKTVYVHDYEQMIKDMKLIKWKKVPLAKKSPFPDEAVEKW